MSEDRQVDSGKTVAVLAALAGPGVTPPVGTPGLYDTIMTDQRIALSCTRTGMDRHGPSLTPGRPSARFTTLAGLLRRHALGLDVVPDGRIRHNHQAALARALASADMPIDDGEIRACIRTYFRVLQSDPTPELMRAQAVTNDFRTGFVGGHMWDGPTGLADFLEARRGFVDEQHDVDEVLGRCDVNRDEAEVQTRLRFHLRDPNSAEVFSGVAFHTWKLRRVADGEIRVAEQLVDGFADLNEPATRLFGHPEEGLSR